MPDNPADNRAHMRVPTHGHGLLRTGGTNPGAGRPTNAFRATMRDLASSDEALAALAAVIIDPCHPQWGSALKLAYAYAYGRPEARLTIEGDVQLRHTAAERIWTLPQDVLRELVNANAVSFHAKLTAALGPELAGALVGGQPSPDAEEAPVQTPSNAMYDEALRELAEADERELVALRARGELPPAFWNTREG